MCVCENDSTSCDVLTSTQGSLGIKYVPAKRDGLGHHLLVKSHFLGVVQGVAHHGGAEDVLHGLPQVRLVAHQGQGRVDVVLSNLTGWREKKHPDKKSLKKEDKNVSEHCVIQKQTRV